MDSFNDTAEIALENSVNIPPTIHKNQGEKIKIFVARDLNFKSAYMLNLEQIKERGYVSASRS
jgi:type IV secretion system protein VirB10